MSLASAVPAYYRFTLATMIPAILDGEKRQTIRLFVDCGRIRLGERFRLLDARDRRIATAAEYMQAWS